MKEAIGTSFVFNLMMIFIGVLIVILISSISYSKAFKIRNRIIDRIEEYNGYDINTNVDEAINEDLQSIGYKVVDNNKNCSTRDGAVLLTTTYSSGYNYCVYEYTVDKGKYYGVTAFISFDIPLIKDYINIPIYGETRTIFDKGMVGG